MRDVHNNVADKKKSLTKYTTMSWQKEEVKNLPLLLGFTAMPYIVPLDMY